jgi:hypothetical protein
MILTQKITSMQDMEKLGLELRWLIVSGEGKKAIKQIKCATCTGIQSIIKEMMQQNTYVWAASMFPDETIARVFKEAKRDMMGHGSILERFDSRKGLI